MTTQSNEYSYPDAGDGLTAELIRTREPYEGYWAASEELVLELALDELSRADAGVESPRMLDAGAGDGRLLERFAPLFDRVTVLEPDPARLARAEEVARRLGDKARCVQQRAEEYEGDGEPFTFILCSHVLQHVSTDSVAPMMRRFAELLSPAGRLLLLTTHSTRERDYFVEAGLHDGRLIEREIDGARFNELTAGREGLLPIRFLTGRTIRALLSKACLSPLEIRSFHVLDPQEGLPAGIERDRFVNASPSRRERFGRDVYVMAAPWCVRFTGSIAWLRAFPDDVEEEPEDGERDAAAAKALEDYETATRFLVGSGGPVPGRTAMRDRQTGTITIVSRFPDLEVTTRTDNLSFSEAAVDEVIRRARELKESSGAEQRDAFLCLEVREAPELPHAVPADLVQDHPRELYGLLTLDEGWRYVPDEVAAAKLAGPWQTRDFFAVFAFGRSVLSINLKPPDYVAAQGKDAGDRKRYFEMRPEIAGLDHGALLVLERCAARYAIGRKVLDEARGHDASTAIEELLELRERLLAGLERIGRLGITELGRFEESVREATEVDRLVDRVREELATVEASVRYRYDEQITRWNKRMAWASFLVALAALIASAVALFV